MPLRVSASPGPPEEEVHILRLRDTFEWVPVILHTFPFLQTDMPIYVVCECGRLCTDMIVSVVFSIHL